MENILKSIGTIARPNMRTVIITDSIGNGVSCEMDFTQIISKIEDIKKELKSEYKFFNSTIDPDLTDSSIYRTIALECEYRYWMRQARKNGVVFSGSYTSKK